MLEYYELTHRRFEDYSSDQDYYQEELEPPRAEAMMEVEVLDAEVKVGPSLGRVLGESGCSFCFEVKIIFFQGSDQSLSSFSTYWEWDSNCTRYGKENMSRKSLYFSNTNKKTNYIDPKNVCLYSASLYSDSRRSSLMCLVPNMKSPSMAR